MVCVVGADVGDGLGDGFDLCVVGSFDELLQSGEILVEFPYCVGPVGGVEFIECLGVVGFGWSDFLASELLERPCVPVEEVIGEHAYRVIFGRRIVRTFGFGNPASLLGGKTGDGGVDRNEPLSVVMGGTELSEQNGLQGGRWASGLGCLCEGEGREEEDEKDSLEGHDGFLFPAQIRTLLVREKSSRNG